ncbi:MAG: transporter substrate-binding domain-containing protein [Pseudomonas marincola]
MLPAEKELIVALFWTPKNVAIVFIFACLQFAPFSAEAQKRETKAISIVTEDFPPYEMASPINGLQGFDYELAIQVFTQLGYEPKITFYPWKRALHEARIGNTVGILTCAYNDDRAKFMLFSDPISEFTSGFYTRKNHQSVAPTTLTDVADQKVASIVEYESLKELQDLGMNPIAAPNITTAIRMLRVKRFDYLYVSKLTTDFEIGLSGLSGEFDFHPISTKYFHFYFSKKFPNVHQIVVNFNTVLKSLKSDGTFEKIRSNYQ